MVSSISIRLFVSLFPCLPSTFGQAVSPSTLRIRLDWPNFFLYVAFPIFPFIFLLRFAMAPTPATPFREMSINFHPFLYFRFSLRSPNFSPHRTKPNTPVSPLSAFASSATLLQKVLSQAATMLY